MFASDPRLREFKGERADYLMRERSVVVELKEFKATAYEEIFELVHPYAEEVGLGTGYCPIDEVIRLHRAARS